jgi:nucleoside-diphosphate kinase
MEKTLIIIKPDGVQRRLIGLILSRFERKGLQLAAAKLMHISESLARRHYAVHEGKPFFEGVTRYLSSSPSLVMVWAGPGAIQICRKLMGKTFGCEAEPGTIRGDFGCSRGYNPITFRQPGIRRLRNQSVFYPRRNPHLSDHRRTVGLQ